MRLLHWAVKSQHCLFKSMLAVRVWLLGLAIIICFQSTFEQVTESWPSLMYLLTASLSSVTVTEWKCVIKLQLLLKMLMIIKGIHLKIFCKRPHVEFYSFFFFCFACFWYAQCLLLLFQVKAILWSLMLFWCFWLVLLWICSALRLPIKSIHINTQSYHVYMSMNESMFQCSIIKENVLFRYQKRVWT